MISNRIELRPSKVLLLGWLISAVLPAAGAGAIAAGAIAAIHQVPEQFQHYLPSGLPPDPLQVGVYVAVPMMALFCFGSLMKFFTLRYELAERHVIRTSGLLWTVRRSIPVEKISSVEVRQGPLDRMFGFGQIWIFTSSTGADTPEEMLVGIREPHTVQAEIFARCPAPSSRSEDEDRDNRTIYGGSQTILLQKILHTLQQIEARLGSEALSRRRAS